MQGLVLQLTRFGFLFLLWLFVLLVVMTLRRDMQLASGKMPAARGRQKDNSARPRGRVARFLVVTHGALANTRITLGDQDILIGRANDSTLVLTDEYASERHARLVRRGDDWYVDDLGSTNGTYLDRTKVTTAVRVPLGVPVRVGKTVIELRP